MKKTFLLVGGLLCGAAVLEAQSAGMAVWNNGGWEYGSRPRNDGIYKRCSVDGYDTYPCPEGEVQSASLGSAIQPQEDSTTAEKVKATVEKKVQDGDPLAAPGMWAYRLSDGEILMDAGGTFAMEVWDCRLIRGHRCFAGAVAGKKTAGVALGVNLKRVDSPNKGRYALIAWIGFVIPYDTTGGQMSPAVGASLKF